MVREHCCNDECKCPHCGGALYYSEKYKQHACVNRACLWIETYDGEGRLKVDKLKERNYMSKTTDANFINELAQDVHIANKKWWVNPYTGEKIERNVGEMLMLVTSELAEALEGHRKNLMDDKLPHRKMIEVELADALIRILDIAAGLGYDLGGAYVEKMAFNAQREDHKLENRIKLGGKAY